MAKQQDYDSFLTNIEPSTTIVQYISSVQNNLRDYLKNHDSYGNVYAGSFLSGSYAKHTSIRPVKDDTKRDVDIIVVTNNTFDDDSAGVLQELYDVLIASSTYKNATIQHHSIGVELSQISIDVVPVIADQLDPDLYWIADSESGEWIVTDPKGHKTWSTDVNQANNKKYKPLVKIFKWWRRINCPSDRKFPKGITLEKIVADNLGSSSGSTEDLLIETMQNIVTSYKEQYVDLGLVPYLDDPSTKICDNDLLEGYTIEDFEAFILKLDEHLTLLNDEGSTCETWRKILGTEFPKGNTNCSAINIVLCSTASHRQKPLWPWSRGGAVIITLKAEDINGKLVPYDSNGDPLEKGLRLHFKALTGVKPPYVFKWQVTNTGEEARKAGSLRGDFYNSDEGPNGRKENTLYTGTHAVQCFIIKKNICVAKSRDFIINIR